MFARGRRRRRNASRVAMGASERSRLILDATDREERERGRFKSKLMFPGAIGGDGERDRGEAKAEAERLASARRRSACACAAPIVVCALIFVGSFVKHGDAAARGGARGGEVSGSAWRDASAMGSRTFAGGASASTAYSGRPSIGHPTQVFDAGRTTGVALHGWLHLEEWFFSQGASHSVAAGDEEANGVCFPPMYPDARSLGFAWASEGDLVNKLVKSFGAKATVNSFNAHRAQYVTDEDLLEIASKGIELIRLPLSWSLFARDPASVPRGGERILVDPVYPDRLFVNMAGADLDAVIERIRNAGLKVLIDLHSMPGGAAKGTFNGVFPHPPMMFARQELRSTGLAVVRNFLGWFKNLPAESRAAVHGLQLLNEPGHMLPEMRAQVLDWMANAVQIFKDEVVNEGLSADERVPFLYINLVETLGLNVADMAAWMRSQFTVQELQEWAVLDVHHYFAWSYTGCNGGSSAGCAFDCRDKPSVVAQRIGELSGEWAGSLRAAAKTYGVQNLAVSEWSLATFSDSSKSCSNREVLDIMYENQEQAYRGAGIQGFFWGWKMPHGGSHVKAWSLSNYLSEGDHEKVHHEIVPHGYDLESTTQTLSEGATTADAARLIRAYSQFAEPVTNDERLADAANERLASTKESVVPVSEVLKLLTAARESAAIGDREVHFPNTQIHAPVKQKPIVPKEFIRASSELEKIIDVDEYAEDEDPEHGILESSPTRATEADESTEPARKVIEEGKKTIEKKPKSEKAKAEELRNVDDMLADISLSNSHVDVTTGTS